MCGLSQFGAELGFAADPTASSPSPSPHAASLPARPLPCRLPHSEAIQRSLHAYDRFYGVQFVAGLERLGEDLLLSYGDMDCEAQVGGKGGCGAEAGGRGVGTGTSVWGPSAGCKLRGS